MVTPSPAHLLEVSAMTLENPWCSAWWWSTRFLVFWFLVFSHGWSHLAQVLSPPCLASMCCSRSPNCPLHCGQTRRTVRISLSLWSSSVSWVGKPIKTLIRNCDGQKHKAVVWQFCDPPTIVIKQPLCHKICWNELCFTIFEEHDWHIEHRQNEELCLTWTVLPEWCTYSCCILSTGTVFALSLRNGWRWGRGQSGGGKGCSLVHWHAWSGSGYARRWNCSLFVSKCYK